MIKPKPISERLVRAALIYDPGSPSGLRWLRDGDPAGKKQRTTDGQIYWHVSLAGVDFAAHRVVWTLVHGPITDDLLIDHWDGDGLNNRIDNLRLVTNTVNQRNQGKSVRNKSGVVGVTYHAAYVLWVASWVELDGKRTQMRFSAKPYGSDIAFFFACEFRWRKLMELQAQGAEYAPRHLAMSKPHPQILETVGILRGLGYFPNS